jgi:hypothetical protein
MQALSLGVQHDANLADCQQTSEKNGENAPRPLTACKYQTGQAIPSRYF